MQVLIPMAGLSSRFFKYGFKEPKYNLPIKGKRMIDLAIESLNIPCGSDFFFVTREEIDGLPGRVIKVDTVTDGPACSAMLAYNYIDRDKPLIITNCDQVLEYSYDNFITECEKHDGCVMTFSDGNPTTKSSYIAFNPTRLTEKIIISDNQLTGVHYFKTANLFKIGYDYMITKNMRAPNGEFYISLVFQALVELGYSVGQYKLSGNEKYHPTGEPLDYFKYLGPFDMFNVYDGFQFGTAPVVYKNGKIFVEGDELEEDPDKYTRGWMIGDFEPCLFRRTDYELGILTHPKLVHHDYHVHNECTEYNLLIEGKINLNGYTITPGKVFIIPKGYISCAIFENTCKILCIKTPSVPRDKVLY